jgi:hypothetical protein
MQQLSAKDLAEYLNLHGPESSEKLSDLRKSYEPTADSIEVLADLSRKRKWSFQLASLSICGYRFHGSS